MSGVLSLLKQACRGVCLLFSYSLGFIRFQLKPFAQPIRLITSASVIYCSFLTRFTQLTFLPCSSSMSDQNLLSTFIVTSHDDAHNPILNSFTPTPASPLVRSTRTVAIIKPHALDHRFEIEHRITEAKFEVRLSSQPLRPAALFL